MRSGERPVLVVEDDPAIRRLVEWTLQDEGLAVDGIADGAEAMRYLASHRPALVVLDVMLPRADGYQVATALRAFHGPGTPILVLTAAEDARDAARRVGADGHLAKPFDLSQLIARVRELLDRPGVATAGVGRPRVAAARVRDDGSYVGTAAGD